jgi:hypothetical protein
MGTFLPILANSRLGKTIFAMPVDYAEMLPAE